MGSRRRFIIVIIIWVWRPKPLPNPKFGRFLKAEWSHTTIRVLLILASNGHSDMLRMTNRPISFCLTFVGLLARPKKGSFSLVGRTPILVASKCNYVHVEF